MELSKSLIVYYFGRIFSHDFIKTLAQLSISIFSGEVTFKNENQLDLLHYFLPVSVIGIWKLNFELKSVSERMISLRAANKFLSESDLQ